jgi:hypothetical protein
MSGGVILASASGVLAEVNPYLTGLFGLFGVLVGGLIAGGVSLVVARQARDAAEASWMRDTRRQVYADFLAKGQALHSLVVDAGVGGRKTDTDVAIAAAYSDVMEAYAVVQTVADQPVVDASRVYAYRLQELEAIGRSSVSLGYTNYDQVSTLVRKARHKVVDTMRTSLQLAGSAEPADGFNPFDDTTLKGAYADLYLQSGGSAPAAGNDQGDVA